MLKRIAMWAGVALSLVLLSTACFGIADGWYVILSKESGKALTVDLSTVYQNSANIKQWMFQ